MAPVAPAGNRRLLLVGIGIASAIIIIALAVGSGWWLQRTVAGTPVTSRTTTAGPTTSQPTLAQPSSPPASTAGATTVAPPPPPPPPTVTVTSTVTAARSATPTPGTLSEADARRLLESETARYVVVTDDHALVELSAKWVGATDPTQVAPNDSHTFYAADIWADYQALKATFGPAVHLVKASTFGKQTPNPKVPPGEPIYVVVYDPGFSGKDAAAAFCRNAYPGLTGGALDNVCLPRPASAPH